MRDRRRLALAAALALASCEMPGTSAPPPSPPPAVAAPDPRVERARELLKQAESEPLPAAPLPPSPRPRKWVPEPAPAFKASEVEAVRQLEAAVAADPGRPEAHDLLAQALEPAVLRRREEEQAAGPKKPLPPPPDQGIDASPARVSRAYRAAVEATPGDGPIIDRMIAFATRVGDLEAADWAYQERIRRARENASAGPLAAYGDFLLDVKKDSLAAAEQYRNVLLWTPGDARVKGRLAAIYLDLARGHFEKQEYAAAESRVKEAAKYVEPGSPEAATLAAYRARLTNIRR
jgi:hypothetical protein